MPNGVFPAERTEKKNKSNNGTQGFAQLRVRCVKKFNGTRGCAKLAQKHAMENGGKTRKMAENAIKIVVLGKIE